MSIYKLQSNLITMNISLIIQESIFKDKKGLRVRLLLWNSFLIYLDANRFLRTYWGEGGGVKGWNPPPLGNFCIFLQAPNIPAPNDIKCTSLSKSQRPTETFYKNYFFIIKKNKMVRRIFEIFICSSFCSFLRLHVCRFSYSFFPLPVHFGAAWFWKNVYESLVFAPS